MATSTGMAKPMPTLPPPPSPDAVGTVAIAVFTPIRAPAQSTSAPPELPGLIEASVYTAPGRIAVTPLLAGPPATSSPVEGRRDLAAAGGVAGGAAGGAG